MKRLGRKKPLPYLIAVLFFAILVGSKYSSTTGFSELAGFGESWEERRLSVVRELDTHVKPNSSGYDGQFYAQIAMDPTLRNSELETAVDSPSYRSRRILLPALAYVIGIGNPNSILQIHSLLNVVAWLWMGALLLHWIPIGKDSRNLARWCTCMFSMGILESVRYSLADLPSIALMLTTLYALEKTKVRWASLSFALSLFAKETSILNAASLFQPGNNPKQILKSPRNRWLVGTSIASLILYSFWLYYVSLRFPIAMEASGNIGIPFIGVLNGANLAIGELLSGNFDSRFTFRILAIGGLLFQFLFILRYPNMHSPIWRFGFIFGVLLLTLGDNVWWGYWAACRISLPMTIAFAILFNPKDDKWFYLGLAGSNLTIIHAVIRWL